ncbi:MAG: T9SS type A sorting domain-containing protein, partial [Bacteroidales bacterium]|nr:T9SS type A sorting domain-containing protein [Bacteroidales bacterium]
HTDQEFTIVVFGQNAIGDNQFDGIQVYPNPATENLYVNITGKNGSYRFIMTDVSGKTILEKPLFLNETSHIDLSKPEIASGLYIYQIVGEKSIHIGKVFINK